MNEILSRSAAIAALQRIMDQEGNDLIIAGVVMVHVSLILGTVEEATGLALAAIMNVAQASNLRRVCMEKRNLFPRDQYPPTNALAAAIKSLPLPGPDVVAQTVEIWVGPENVGYRVTFVPRRNPEHRGLPWFWGIGSGEKISLGQVGGAAELQDPD